MRASRFEVRILKTVNHMYRDDLRSQQVTRDVLQVTKDAFAALLICVCESSKAV